MRVTMDKKVLRIVFSQPQDGQVHVSQLHEQIDAGFDEVKMNDTADFVLDRHTLLKEAVGKVRYGGSIEIHGVDLLSLSCDVNRGITSCDAFNAAVFQQERVSLSSVIDVARFVRECGLFILDKRINNNRYFVRAIRPDAPTN